MEVVHHCKPDEFCESCTETGGEYGAPYETHCMASPCRYPGKTCVYIKMGGKRPQDGE